MNVKSDKLGSQIFTRAPVDLTDEIVLPRILHGTVLKVNRFGTSLAVGSSCGDIFVYDYTTKLLVYVCFY